MSQFHPRLGRKAIKHDTRRLMVRTLLPVILPPPPASVDWTKGESQFGMMLNDRLGCCTIAGVAHAIQVFTFNSTGTMVTVADSTIQQYYESFDGYNPEDPSSDAGGIEADVLTKWRKLGFDGHVLDAFGDADPKDVNLTKTTISLFGGTYIGFTVPNYIMNNLKPDIVWDVPKPGDDTGIDGGHCVFAVGYDSQYVYVISWGQVFRMTWTFWLMFVDESHPLISKDFLNTQGVSPTQVDLVTLDKYLDCIH